MNCKALSERDSSKPNTKLLIDDEKGFMNYMKVKNIIFAYVVGFTVHLFFFFHSLDCTTRCE